VNDPIQAFLAEASELNENIYAGARNLRDAIDAGTPVIHAVNDLFRAFHTLKGLAGMHGLGRLSRFAHDVEDLLDAVRKGQREPDDELVRLLILSTELVDLFLDAVRTIGSDAIEEKHLASFTSRLETMKAGMGSAVVTLPDSFPREISSQLNDQETARLAMSIRNGLTVYAADISLPFDTFDADLRTVQDDINQNGEMLAVLPGEDAGSDTRITFRLLFSSTRDLESLRPTFPGEATIRVLVEGRSPETPAKTDEPPVSQPRLDPGKGDSAETVRVSLQSLDRMMQQLEELLQLQARALAAVTMADESSARQNREQLRFLLQLGDERIRQLQKQVVQFRMVPIGSIFRQLESAVLKTAEATGKNVRLTLSGESTRIDKQLTDQLMEPLIHLLRNAVDHGIEPLGEREKAGKPASGTIRMDCMQQGNAVVIGIQDDGRGLDLDRILQRAIDNGLATRGRKYETSELIDMLFEPGFSTAETITDISGRGVGLDVVKTEINRLGGTISVSSTDGNGTAVRIQLPITRAILPICFVSNGNVVLGLPLLFVTDIRHYEPERASYVRDRLFYRLDNESLPTIHLPLLLKTMDLTTEPGIVIVMQHFGTRFCVLAEDILDEREVTVTPFRGKLSQMPMVSGICTYSDRNLGYILDVPRMIQIAGGHRAST